MYDYLIVGAGLYGAVFARQAADAGKKVLVVDKRDHIAGNVYTEKIEGINVHRMIPHVQSGQGSLIKLNPFVGQTSGFLDCRIIAGEGGKGRKLRCTI